VTVESLSVALWRQRDLLTEVHHQLYVQSLLLRDGASNHHLSRSTQVIKRLENETGRAGLLVMVNIDALSEEFGIGYGARLHDLVEASPDDITKEILIGHLSALTALTDKVRQYASENSQVLGVILKGTKSQLEDPSSYSQDGLIERLTPVSVVERTM
jgi:hypothetical protein